MAHKSIIEELRAFVDEETGGLGAVGNLHGVVETADLPPDAKRPQAWWVGVVATPSAPDLAALFRAFTYERPGYTAVDGDALGLATFPGSGASLPAGSAVFFYGAARVSAARRLALRARGEGASIAVYVDGVQVGAGQDTLTVSPELGAGTHAIVVVLHGATKPVTVESSPDVEIARSEVAVPTPSWHTPPVPYMLEPAKGTVIARMAWGNDAQASAWHLYRAASTEIGRVQGLPTVDAEEGTLTLRVDTSGLTLVEGATLFTEYFPLGVLVTSTPVEGQAGHADLVVIPALTAEEDLTTWAGLRCYVLGADEALGVIPNAGTDTVVFDDNKVRRDALYVYRLTSVGPFGLTESAFSSPQWVFTNDEDPPQGIDWDPAQPPEVVASGFDLTVRFVAPPDLDYAGVRVYGPYPLSENGDIDPPAAFSADDAVLTKLGAPLARDQVTFRVQEDAPDSAYFVATFDALGNEQRPVAWTSRRTGVEHEPAFATVWDGPQDAVFGANTSIELDINMDDVRNTDAQTVLILRTYPREATLKTWVDRELLALGATHVVDGRTFPALTELPTVATDEYHAYEVVLTKIEGRTVEFIATTKGTAAKPMRPFSLTYKMDADPFPGISGVHVEDRRQFPEMWVTMDDDARYVRLVRTDNGADEVLYTATKLTGVDASRLDYGTAVLHYIENDAMTADERRTLRVDASKDGTLWTDVWHGVFLGPELGEGGGTTTAPGVKFDVDVSTAADGVTQVHLVNVTVVPADAVVFAQWLKDDGQRTEVVDLDPALGDGDLFRPKTVVGDPTTPIPGRYEFRMTRDPRVDQKFILTATYSGVPHTGIYALDRDTLAGAYVDVENRRKRPIITAIMDDDANALRIVQETRDEAGGVTSSTPIAVVHRGVGDNITLKWQYPVDLAVDATIPARVEASKENTATPSADSWRTVWAGTLVGPHPDTITASIDLTATVAGTAPELHTLLIRVRPPELLVLAHENTAEISPIVGNTNTSLALVRTYTDAVFSDYAYVVARSTMADKRIVVRAGSATIRPATATYTLDRDDEPEAAVSAEDRRTPIRLNAVADDDTTHVRVKKGDGTYRPSEAGQDVSTVKTYTYEQPLAEDEEETFSVEAKKGSAPWRTVWTQRLKGPAKDTKTAAISLASVQTENAEGQITSEALTLTVSPSLATVSATINGEAVALTAGAVDAALDRRTYTLTLTPTETTQRLMVTASRTGYYPATATYVLDADLAPEVDSVSVADRRDPAIITAYVDDDCHAMRFVEIVGAARVPEPALDTRVTKSQAISIDLDDEEEQTWAIEVRGRAGGPYDAWGEVWSQTIKGPPTATPPASLDVTPKDSTLTHLDVEWAAPTDTDVFITWTSGVAVSITPGESGSLGNSTNPASDAGVLRVTRPASGSAPALVTFRALKYVNSVLVATATSTIDVAPIGSDAVAPDLVLTQVAADTTTTVAAFQVAATHPRTTAAVPVTLGALANLTTVTRKSDAAPVTVGETLSPAETYLVARPGAGSVAGLLTVEAAIAYTGFTLRERVTWPVDAVSGAGSACTLKIESVTVVEPTHDVQVLVAPVDATVTAAINGGAPLIPVASTPASGLYTFRVTRALLDQRLIVTATKLGFSGTSLTYTIDRDNEPECEVTVQNYRARPSLAALMDDDAKFLRLTDVASGTVLRQATKQAGSGTATASFNTSVLTYLNEVDLAADAERKLLIEASKDGTTWVVAWRGSFFGARGGPSITLTPSSTTSTMSIAWVAGPGATVAVSTTGIPSTLYTTGSSTSTSGTILVQRPAITAGPGTIGFAVTKDGVTDTKTVTVPQIARDSIPPRLVIDPIHPSQITARQQELMTAQGWSSSWSETNEARIYLRAENLVEPGITLEYAIGTSGYTQLPAPGATTVDTVVRVLRSVVWFRMDWEVHVRALQTGATALNLTQETSYAIDWDTVPEVSDLRAVAHPATGDQVGWLVSGTADDDAEYVTLTLEQLGTTAHGCTLATPAGAPHANNTHTVATPTGSYVALETNKTFSVLVLQGAGSQVNVVATPKKRDNVTAGTTSKLALTRPPITNVQIEDGSGGDVTLLFTTNPVTASVAWKLTGAVSHIAEGARIGLSRKVTVPRPPKGTASALVVEYFATAGGVQEATQRMPIDHNDIANVTATAQSPTANRLEVSIHPDDDTARWQVYARLNGAPNQNPDYLKAGGDRARRSVAMYASTGTWYIEVVGSNWAGSIGPVYATQCYVSGATATQVPQSGAALNSMSVSRSGASVVIAWAANPAGQSGTVNVYRRETASGSEVLVGSYAASAGVAYDTSMNFGNSFYGEYTYTATLASSSLSAVFGDYFIGQQGATVVAFNPT